jgi:N5-(cytidine 5'-diphosphoramidyl)-L-glutamine hydrolase
MKRVGLTMRHDPTPHGEWRDALDAEWSFLIGTLGFMPLLLSNKGIAGADVIKAYGLDAVLLTGGNDVVESGKTYSRYRNDLELGLLEAAEKKKIPVVGICRGMQIMNLYGGGTVKQIDGHVGSDHPVTWNGKSCTVNSYHNYGIDRLSGDMVATAQALDASIEAFRHQTLPWQAVMWHPERAIENPEIHYAWLKAALQGEAP